MTNGGPYLAVLPHPATGIVHLGLGAFFRAFGCPFVADAMAASGGDWGIAGVSLRSADTRDALRGQGRGWDYTAVSLGPNGAAARHISVLNDVLVAPETPHAVLQAMADPLVRIVSLTVTEKGYCHDPVTGRLNPDHPDIRADLMHEAPRSAPGYIVRALQMRFQAGARPFTVLSCDNLPTNGALTRRVVLDLAQRIDPDLAAWIASEARFPSTMVDRITPATAPDDLDFVAELTGTYDRAPVLHEPFRQWAIEDDFVDGARPDFAAAGAEMVKDVTAHETMKLRMLNGTHSALAYLGYLAGYETISCTVADPDFADFTRTMWDEIAPTVTAPKGTILTCYAETLMERYTNPAIRHRTWQIAMDGSQKLPQRLLETLRDRLDAGQGAPALCLAVAGWMRYAGGVDERGAAIDVRDPMADRLAEIAAAHDSPAERVAALLELSEIFPPDLAPRLREPLTEAAERLWALGARDAVTEVAR